MSPFDYALHRPTSPISDHPLQPPAEQNLPSLVAEMELWLGLIREIPGVLSHRKPVFLSSKWTVSLKIWSGNEGSYVRYVISSPLYQTSLVAFPNIFHHWLLHGSVSKPCTPVVHIKIAGKWMFIPLELIIIGYNRYWSIATCCYPHSFDHHSSKAPPSWC